MLRSFFSEEVLAAAFTQHTINIHLQLTTDHPMLNPLKTKGSKHMKDDNDINTVRVIRK